MPKHKNRIGQKFGKLTVLADVGRKFNSVLWRCKCECGEIVDVRAASLVCGDRKSCAINRGCHHAWEGGVKNVGSVAWAKSRIRSLAIKSNDRGHQPPNASPEQVIELWKKAGGKCCVCKKQKALCLDHCHKTGAVRGFICSTCNTALGHVGESVEILQNAIDYLNSSCKPSKDGVVRSS